MLRLRSLPATLAAALPFVPGLATAAETIHPGGFPTAIGSVAEQITHLYNIIFIITAVIAVIVVVGVSYILWNYRASRVKKPATFSHSLTLELLWTIIPALICVFIGYKSYEAMVHIRTMPENAVNVEVVAYQFGWDFFYPDAAENGTTVSVAAPTGPDPEISLKGLERTIPTLVVPAGKNVVLHITASDVLHAFFVPHLGIKIDAIPGRINYAWFNATTPGNYLGQCAELCGSAHGEMFFRVKAVPEAEFEQYIRDQRVAAGLTPEKAAPAAEPVSASAVVSTSAAIGVSATEAAAPAAETAPAH